MTAPTVKRYLSISAILFMFTISLNAGQSQGAEVHGVVRDDSRAVVPGASVTLTDGGQHLHTTTTDASGAYVLRDLPPGRYALVVLLQGFAPASQQIELVADLRARVDV